MPAVELSLEGLAPGATRVVEAAGRQALVCVTPAGVFAVAERCTHAAATLREARLEGCVLECPYHGARFDVRDGSVLAGPARRALATFPISVTGAEARIEL